jgi:ankyrin repeat protein
LLQDVSAGEHAEADFSASGSGDDKDINNNEESVDDPVIGRLDSISMCMDPNFTSCGESPITVGRCFMEVEHQIFGANTRPVIVADKDMCSELRKLEEEIDMAAISTAQTAELQGLEPVEVLGCSEVARLIVEEDRTCFLHELGWFFQSSSYQQQGIPASLDRVHAVKLKCLLIFSVERNWCTVVRKLLDVACGHRNIESGVSRLSQVLKDDVSLLHRAVRNKDRCMVELLLAYVPPFVSSENYANSDGVDQFSKVMQFKLQWGNLFRPDMSGPAGLTPLHVAASLQDAEAVVDALTSDPFQVGLHAWLNRRDDNGETPLTCAVACKNFKAVNLVRDKLARLQGTPGEVRNNMLLESLPQSWIQKPAGDLESGTGGSSVQLSVFDNGVRGK